MAVEITGNYLGNLKMELHHGPSGAVLLTAAPVDNQGDGSSFSPTDLVAAAMASCMVTTMGIVAQRHAIDLARATFRVEKHMTHEGPRRIAALPVEIHLPASLTPEQRQLMERTAHTCPVHRSLIAEVDRPIRFVYDA
ncbi:MAG: OsmC family protein [Acidobacteriota bacterium]